MRGHDVRTLGLVALALAVGAAGCPSCAQLEEGRAYRCSADAGAEAQQCEPGWRCGHDGRCIDESTPAAYGCATDGDCVGGWVCGQAPTDGDCVGGWVCGQAPENVCHAPGAAAAYLCSDDVHCEGGWRCGPEGRCLDPAADALRADAFDGPLHVTRLSPSVGAPGSDRVAGPVSLNGRFDESRVDVAGAAGTDLWFARPEWGQTPPAQPVLGQPFTRYAVTRRPSGRAQVRDVGRGTGTFVLHEDGLDWYEPEPDGGVRLARTLDMRGDAVRVPDSYTLGTFASDGGVWIASEALGLQYVRVDKTAPLPGVNDLHVPTLPGGGTRGCLVAATDSGLYVAPRYNAVNWMTAAATGFSRSGCAGGGTDAGPHGCQPCSTARGACTLCGEPGTLWCTNSTAPVWHPLVLGGDDVDVYSDRVAHAACPAAAGSEDAHYDAPMRVRAITAGASGSQAIFLTTVVMEDGQGGQRVVVYGPRAPSGERASTGDGQGCGRVDVCAPHMGTRAVLVASNVGPVARDAATCTPCPAGHRLVDARAVGAQPVTVHTLCEEPAQPGRVPRQRFWQLTADPSRYLETFCSREPLDVTAEPLAPARSNYFAQGFQGAHGNLFTGSDSRALQPLLFDRAPDVVVGERDDLLVFRGRRYGQLDGPDGLGLVTAEVTRPGFETPVAHVEGAPGWVVTRTGQVADLRPDAGAAYPPSVLAQLAGDVVTFNPPYAARTTGLSDGGTLLVLSAFDALLAADVTGARPSEFPEAQLRVRAVPAPGSPIRAFVTLPPAAAADGGAPAYAAGWVLTQAGLFRVDARTDNRWAVAAVELPEGEPLAVWADGARGRVGFRDGRVLALPSRVPVAPSLPEEAVAYAQLRGQAFALTGADLYRLTPGPAGTPVGTWRRVEGVREALPSPGGDRGLAGGRLHATGDALLLFTAQGVTLRLTPAL